LKVQIEEAKAIEEVLKGQLRQRERIQEELEIEILSLKKQLGEAKFGQEERRLENEIITLKTQLEEAKKIEEAMKNQMMKREEEVEKLEEEVVMLRSKIIKFNNNKQTETSTSEVKSEEKHSRVLEEKNNSYAEVLKGGNHGTSSARPTTFKQQRTFKHDEEIHKRKYHDQARHKFKSATQQGRSSTPMYENFFYGYCFYCSNFGHKVADCRAHQRNYQIRKAYVAPHNIECYKCHNYGHIARDCRSMMDTSLRSKWSWKGKQEQKKRDKINERQSEVTVSRLAIAQGKDRSTGKKEDVKYRKIWRRSVKQEEQVNKGHVPEITGFVVAHEEKERDQSIDRKAVVRVQKDDESINKDADDSTSEHVLF